MALTEPLDLLTDFPGWSTEFDLLARQEQSRHASGRTRVKDFGQPLWRGRWQSKTLSPNALDMWRAKLSHVAISQLTFLAWPSSRCWPISHPRGELVDLKGWVLETGFWNDAGVWRSDVSWGGNSVPSGSLDYIGDDNQTIRVSGLVGVALSIGDFLQIGSNIYRVLEPAEGPLTNLFTIEPHIRPGNAVGQGVTLHKPSCLMTIVPGSVSAPANPGTGRGAISFEAMEAL